MSISFELSLLFFKEVEVDNNFSLKAFKMGLKFGELAKMRGIIQYRLSPYEQNIFAGFFSKGFPNLGRRIRNQILVIAPPFIGAYLIYDWANKEFARLQRKNPKDYENDV
ncbi:hypothetical protein JTE90_022118 [Oedothorax gibbosus]|uniref:Cytochrome b-c1 complex subunit 8 n=1 Tax=Oedothorax gibbosus TaxID=931172 RepID=A0AAV6VV34_9ARAC|nr:hypothetical protein JTE90_022118 [Oedothorax gibbosus]